MANQRAEAVFHDEWASEIDLRSIDLHTCFEGSTAPENRWIIARLGNLSGKRLLDLGCGAGEAAVYFAKRGAISIACDISEGMLSVAHRLASRHGVTINTCRCSAERLPFVDNSFDIVYAANVLHHIGLEKGLAEIRRVLNSEGVAATWDPLGHNPAIAIYRRMSRGVHSTDEHPLSLTATLRSARSMFRDVEYSTFWLATLWIFLRFFFIERVNPNHERYWKKIYTDEKRLRKTYLRLERIDRLLLRIPFLKRYAWNVALVMRK